MSTIGFVVRDLAGNIHRGDVTGQVNSLITAGIGDDISLNLDPSMVLSYSRHGQALEILLVDGRLVVVEGFFSPEGLPQNEVFLSTNGQMVRADLLSLDNGVLYADYLPQEPFGALSPDTSLFFGGEPEAVLASYHEAVAGGYSGTAYAADAGMFAAPILGGIAGVGGLASGGALVTGAAVVGGAALLTGGDVVNTASEGGQSSGDPIKVTISEVNTGADGTLSSAEIISGLTLHGTTGEGTTVMVTVGGVAHEALVEGSEWTLIVPPNAIPSGEYDLTILVHAEDLLGNSVEASSKIPVDTTTFVTIDTSAIGADGIINAQERLDGFDVTGTAQAFAVIDVTFGDITHQVTANGAGQWSAYFAPSEIERGTYDGTVTATAHDAAGNHASVSGVVIVDTVAPDAPYIVSANFYEGELGDIGIPDNDASIKVYELDGEGGVTALGNTAVDARFDTVQLQLDTFIPDGRQLVVTTQDEAGNSSATLMVFDQAETDLVNIDDNGLSGFEISAIDLQYAAGSNLVLDEADIERLSGQIGRLTIHGGTDDEVTLVNATKTGTTVIDNEPYDIYVLGEDGVLLLDEAINLTF